ncbi:hypothetical protein GC163_17050 [bacterium]|nr:hypothetical protein [bacterium]
MDSEAETSLVSGTRHRPLETPSVSPWLPLTMWKCVALVTAFWTSLAVTFWLLTRPVILPESVARLLTTIVVGPNPRLMQYVDVMLWLLAAEFAGLIGWYRSHSQLDFWGRYRTWGWVAITFAGAGFLSLTRLHEIVAVEYLANSPYLSWRRETLAWIAPMAIMGALTAWLIDRDIRRCVSSLVIFRLAVVAWCVVAAGYLWAPELSCEAWYPLGLLGSRLLAAGLLVTALWRQACFVAYVCPDPPEKSTSVKSRTMFGFLMRRWWKPQVAEKSEDVKPSRRRRKAAEESESEGETAAPKRRRKAPAKPRKTTKRTRPKADPGEVEYEEEASEETSDESWESGSEDESTSGTESTNWTEDDELAQLEALTRPDNASNSNTSSSQSWNESDDDDSDGDYGGIDAGHRGDDAFKGLSKRQRRELKRQQREASRDR